MVLGAASANSASAARELTSRSLDADDARMDGLAREFSSESRLPEESFDLVCNMAVRVLTA